MRRGELIRLAPGTFVRGKADEALDRDERYRLEVRAVARHRCLDVLVSHVSAAALHGLPILGRRPDEVHLTRPGVGGSRSGHGVRVHAGLVPEAMRGLRDGVPVTSVARTVVDAARADSTATAVAVGDAALHRGLVTPAELATALDDAAFHQGTPRARRALALLDGRAESPGESGTRLSLRQFDVPHLELQVWILNESGRRVGRVDLACLRYGVLIEIRRPGQIHQAVETGSDSGGCGHRGEAAGGVADPAGLVGDPRGLGRSARPAPTGPSSHRRVCGAAPASPRRGDPRWRRADHPDRRGLISDAEPSRPVTPVRTGVMGREGSGDQTRRGEDSELSRHVRSKALTA